MAINFPHNPSANQVFTAAGKSWKWDGTTWNVYTASTPSSIGLASLSAENANAGTTSLAYNNSTGVFTYTPPDLSGYITTQYTLPTATTSALGGVKVDGSSITINSSGVISGASTYTLPTASSTVIGGIKVGSNLTINAAVLSADTQVPTSITVADESTDTTCYPIFSTQETGNISPKTGTNIKFNSSSGELEAGSFKKTGGISTGFLKADGSVDSNTYLTSFTEADTLASVTGRGNSTTTACSFQDVTITGNLSVSGTTTTINSTTLSVGDNQITLNGDLGGSSAPTENVSIVANRGNQTDAEIRWNETGDKWEFNNGTTDWYDIPTSSGSSIPTGVIVLWSGAANAIPTGWALCDGSVAGRPDLRSKFVVGASASGGYSVGATGGSADAITVSHNHSTNNTGGHSHDSGNYGTNNTGNHSHSQSGSGSGNTGNQSNNHYHTIGNTTVSTSNTGNHSHTYQLSSWDNSGNTVGGYDVSGDSGSAPSTSNTGAHSHTVNLNGVQTLGISQDHTHGFNFNIGGNTGNTGSHSHNINGNSNNTGGHSHNINTTGSSGTNKNLPPYWALCYIIKT